MKPQIKDRKFHNFLPNQDCLAVTDEYRAMEDWWWQGFTSAPLIQYPLPGLRELTSIKNHVFVVNSLRSDKYKKYYKRHLTADEK